MPWTVSNVHFHVFLGPSMGEPANEMRGEGAKASEAGERASVFSEHRALCRNRKDFCKTTLDVS